MTEQLTRPEQLALMETINILPLANIIAGSVELHDADNGKVAVTFGGVAIIPRKQLESVRQVVETERMAAEEGSG